MLTVLLLVISLMFFLVVLFRFCPMGVEVEEGGNGGGSIVDDGGVGMEGCCFYMGIEGVLWYLGLNGEWGL